MVIAILLQDFVTGDLNNLRSWNVCRVTLQGPVDDVVSCSTSVIFLWATLLACWEVLDGWVTLDTVFLSLKFFKVFLLSKFTSLIV